MAPPSSCKIIQATWLKQSNVPAAQLDNRFKAFINAGTYPISSWEQSVSGYFKVSFRDPIASAAGGGLQYNTWLVYGEHVTFLDPSGATDLRRDCCLSVPYASQRLSKTPQWNRMCCSASSWMLAMTLKPALKSTIPDEDAYLTRLNSEQGDTTDHDAHSRFLKGLGIESQWRRNLDLAFLDRSLLTGVPVVISVYHRGSLAAPSGGHCIVIVGRSGDDYICNDPWGEGFADNYDLLRSGKSVKYPAHPSLERRWLSDGDRTGWGRVVSAIDGKETGLGR